MWKTISLLLFTPFFLLAQNTPEKTLQKAINYHDPQARWATFSTTLKFRETRPEGPDRSTMISLDNSRGYMKINRDDEEIYEVNEETGTVLKGDRDIERALVLRNYYLYIWGLPMKLLDQSTPKVTLKGDEYVAEVQCNVLRVAYEKDTWYFYFDSASGRMLQYKFYEDEEETQGELITLEDEIEVDNIKIPQKRSWYTLPEMKYLGTDILEEVNE